MFFKEFLGHLPHLRGALGLQGLESQLLRCAGVDVPDDGLYPGDAARIQTQFIYPQPYQYRGCNRIAGQLSADANPFPLSVSGLYHLVDQA
jgi:hypothetical protein